ncbi:hypothetical protein ACWFNE_11220 [Cellulomonas sp. NPDC055163]
MALSTTTWVGGSVFAAVLALAGGWTLGVSPQLDAAEEAQLQQVTVEDQNIVLQRDLVELEAQFANLDQYRADLAALEAQIPPTAELSEYLRQVSTVVDSTGAFLVSVKPGEPVTVAEAVAAAASSSGAVAAPAAPAEGEASEGGETAAPAEDPATAGAPAPSTTSVAPVDPVITGFTAIPIDISLLGSVQNVTNALNQLQTGTTRLMLVTGISGSGTDAKEASEGKPATNLGDLELTLSGYLWVVQPPAAPATDDGTSPAPLPQGDLTKPFTKSA